MLAVREFAFRALLMGHAMVDMASHYATATIVPMIGMANAMQDARDATTVLRVIKAGESRAKVAL